MRGDRSRVPAGSGPGDARNPLGEGAIERGLEKRAHVQGGILDASLGQDSGRLHRDARDEVGAVSEARVVEGAVLLGNDDGFAAHFDDESLGDRQEGGRGRHSEGRAHEARHVDAGTGEGHRRVDGERDRSRARGGAEQPHAGGTRQVNDDVPALPGAQVGQAAHKGANLVVRDGHDDHLGASHDLLGRGDRHAGQHRVGALARGVRGRGDGNDLVADRAQRRADDGPDVAHADDADSEASGGTHGPIVADHRATCRPPHAARSPRRSR